MVHYQPCFWPTAELASVRETRDLRVAGTVFDTHAEAVRVLREQSQDVEEYGLPVTPCIVHCNERGEVIKVEPLRD